MQAPCFQERGLDISGFYPGTINLSIAPLAYAVRKAKYTFRNVKWSPHAPAEDFSFFDCRIRHPDGRAQPGLVYYPHPETKPEHVQPPSVLEILTDYVEGLGYGDTLVVELDEEQLAIRKPIP